MRSARSWKLSGCGRNEFRVFQLLQDSRQLSNAVANREYIERLRMVIRQLHKCDAEHTGTEPVKEVFRRETVWEGDVEVFNVTGHPRARRAYAWSVDEGTPQERFTAVLEIPPVKSALDAVKVAIVAAAKEGNEEDEQKAVGLSYRVVYRL